MSQWWDLLAPTVALTPTFALRETSLQGLYFHELLYFTRILEAVPDCLLTCLSFLRRAKKRLEIQGIVRSATPPGDSLSVRGPANWEPGLDRGDELSLPTTPSGNLFVDSTYEPFGGQRDGGSLTNEDFLSRILGENDNALSSGLRPSPPIGSVQPLLPFTKDQTFNSSVPFSCYRFLELRGLAGLTPEDVRYLESKGCLHVPSGPHLDQLVQQYFSHVHPFMPILDEEEFWYMYACRQHDLAKGCGLSLLVFQAMLFAASTVSIAVCLQRRILTDT
jgi:hypothetical protein